MAGLAASRELSVSTSDVCIATPADDAELRALLRASAMPGAIRLASTREPSYAAGEHLAGADDVTVLARQQGRVVAMGRCSTHRWLRNGAVARVGYLGELRVTHSARASARLIRDGYAALADAAAESAPAGFVTCITTDNTRARRVLEHGGRLGVPQYDRLASLVTVATPVPTVPRSASETACRPDEVEELTAYLRAAALDAHLTLDWGATVWSDLKPHGISPGAFDVVRHHGSIVAAGAVWDQRSFRQVVVDGYDGALRVLRPLVNVFQAARGQPALPAPGAMLAIGAVLGAAVSDARYWPELYSALSVRALSLGVEWLAITRSDGDPQLAAIRRVARGREYCTSLYDVRWQDRPGFRDAWDLRPFRPEVGLL